MCSAFPQRKRHFAIEARDLGLKRPIYSKTAAYGHFGRTDIDLPWEHLDRVDALREAAKQE